MKTMHFNADRFRINLTFPERFPQKAPLIVALEIKPSGEGVEQVIAQSLNVGTIIYEDGGAYLNLAGQPVQFFQQGEARVKRFLRSHIDTLFPTLRAYLLTRPKANTRYFSLMRSRRYRSFGYSYAGGQR